MSTTLQVHREFCHHQEWIEEMINFDKELLKVSNTMPKTAVIQHHVLIYWLSKGLFKIYSKSSIDNSVTEEMMVRFIESLNSISTFHPSLLIVGLLYFDKYMKLSNSEFNLDTFKAHFIVCIVLACKMYEDLEPFNYGGIFKNNIQKFVQLETNVLKILNYDLVISYDDFLELIHQFSKDIYLEVACDVLESWKKIC